VVKFVKGKAGGASESRDRVPQAFQRRAGLMRNRKLNKALEIASKRKLVVDFYVKSEVAKRRMRMISAASG
jgi:hypothetical protein